MDSSNGFVERIRRNAPLAELTWFKLGGPARYMFSPADIVELQAALRWAADHGLGLRVLGGGANLLVRDAGFDGLVLRLDAPAFTEVRYHGERVTAGAGADLMALTRDCAYRGLSGIECLAGVPGTVGGAVRMNAGGRYGQIGDVVESVRLMERTGRILVLPAGELDFAYRRSAVGERIVIEATLQLVSLPVDEVKSRFQEIWAWKKDSQPMAAHCAGCMFKNPVGDSAGRLIEFAGLKGVTRGRARVSERHGNFIVADEGATAGDVLALVEQVQACVREKTGVKLELEVDVW